MATVVDEKAVFEYLDELQASNVINMFSAGAYLKDEFGVNRHQAKTLVLKWMRAKKG